MKHYNLRKTTKLKQRISDWYQSPVNIKIHFNLKKSTIVIFLLLAYIIWGHLHARATIHYGDQTIPTKYSQISKISTIKTAKFEKAEQLDSVEVEPPETAVNGSCGDNPYAQFIYMHESGCDTYDPNPTSGACGIGQAWPCEKLPCGYTSADYACQNAFFTSYALARYGSWEAAYNFWVANRYW